MYRSNQTDHSPPSIFHIVNSRHKSTSPAFEFELPSPQPSPNRYVPHFLPETVRKYKSDGRADGLHKYNLSSQVILHRDCYLRINQDYTENNDQQSYYHHPHLSCSHLLSSNEHLPIKRPFGHLLMLSESLSSTWNSPEAHDRSDAFGRNQSWKAFAFCAIQ